MAERDTLDAINAEVCYNVIVDLQKKKKMIGALYHQADCDRKRKAEELEKERFYRTAKDILCGCKELTS